MLVIPPVAALLPLWKIAPPVGAGMFAVFLLLPRPRPFSPRLGAAVGALALLLTGVYLIDAGTISTEDAVFYCFAGVALLAGALTVTQRDPARAALSFVLVVLSSCGLFLLQAAPFLMAATIIIYAGAIIVTFLFVLMLAQRAGPSSADDRSREPVLATLGGFFFLGGVLALLRLTYGAPSLDAVLVPYLERARVAATRTSIADMEQDLGADFFDRKEGVIAALGDYEQDTPPERLPPGFHTYLASTLEAEVATDWTEGKARGEVERMRKALQRLVSEGEAVRVGYGRQPPSPEVPLSDFSGSPSNTTIRHDSRGSAPLPAANVAAVGRALFTDFLVAVELAGTLLLVAAVGAVIIACRTPSV